jgi:hypothetical protein
VIFVIFSNSIKYEDLTSQLDKENDVITIIGCNTCIRVSGAGGPEKMRELALKLKKDGYNVKDGFMLPIACMEPYLATAKLSNEVNTIVVLACTAGVSNIKRNYPHLKVVETVDNIGLIVADTNKGVLKVAMPYEKHNKKLGEEYPIGSDGKNKMPNQQIPIQVGVK